MKNYILLSFCVMIVSITSCQKFDLPSLVQLYHGETYQIKANQSSGVSYSSSDEFYATVSETGEITANKVGKTEIKVSSYSQNGTISVSVLPEYYLYPQLESLLNHSTTKMIELLGSDYEINQTSSAVYYDYENYNEYTSLIRAEVSNGFVTKIAVGVAMSYLTKLVGYLAERYTVAGKLNDYYYFFDHDKATVITLATINARYMGVVYVPYDTSKASGDDLSSIIDSYLIYHLSDLQ